MDPNPVDPLSANRKSKKITESGSYIYFKTQLPKENPLSYFYTYVKPKNLILFIQGCYIEDSFDRKDLAHSWYYNNETNTEYECFYRVSGDKIVAERVENPFECNYKGDNCILYWCKASSLGRNT